MDECREAFEVIYRPLYENDGKTFPKFNGEQYEGFVQLQWDGWKSCWEQRNKHSDIAPGNRDVEIVRYIATGGKTTDGAKLFNMSPTGMRLIFLRYIKKHMPDIYKKYLGHTGYYGADLPPRIVEMRGEFSKILAELPTQNPVQQRMLGDIGIPQPALKPSKT